MLHEALNRAREVGSRGWGVSDAVKSVLAAKGGDVGLAVRACAEICECLSLDGKETDSSQNIVGQLSCQYVQIYNEKISCLLGSTNEVMMRGEIMQGARTVKVSYEL